MKKNVFWGIALIPLLFVSCQTAEGISVKTESSHNHSTTTSILSAKESDPASLGWMVGSPPPQDKTVYFEDGSYFTFPAIRWTVSNFRQLMPTVNVSRGLGNPSILEVQLRDDIDSLEFTPLNTNNTMTWEESLYANYTDGIIVLHKGNVVYERYFGVLEPEGQHGAMSVTKSYIGTLASMLVAEGILDETKLVKYYVPELAESGFGDATVRQVMDMTTGIKFSEDYTDPNAEVWQHSAAGNPLPKPEGYTGPRTYYQFLETVQKEGEHGEAFAYRTANTDCLGWIISRVTDMNVHTLLSERIWSKIGAEQSAYFSCDSIGTPFAGGGFSAGIRDMARFGQMILQNGYYNGQQILPEKAIEDIKKGGKKEDFAKAGYKLLPDWSYRNMWWMTHNEHEAFAARGVHGQTIYIDPTAEMVIVRFASNPVAGNAANDPTSLPAYHALAKLLMEK